MLDRRIRTARLLVAAAVFACASAHAYDGPVRKQVFELPAYTTQGGQAIGNVRIGDETCGRLNEARDNVIRISHFFSGTSHAAGKYRREETAPGYRDAIIGSGRAIDTSALRAEGNAAEVFEIQGEGGHDDGIFQISKAAKAISDFLAR